jgi:hypothetical protein
MNKTVKCKVEDFVILKSKSLKTIRRSMKLDNQLDELFQIEKVITSTVTRVTLPISYVIHKIVYGNVLGSCQSIYQVGWDAI